MEKGKLTEKEKYLQKCCMIPIRSGNDVWIGAGVCVMPGVTIGNNVVIGSGSVVVERYSG